MTIKTCQSEIELSLTFFPWTNYQVLVLLDKFVWKNGGLTKQSPYKRLIFWQFFFLRKPVHKKIQRIVHSIEMFLHLDFLREWWPKRGRYLTFESPWERSEVSTLRSRDMFHRYNFAQRDVISHWCHEPLPNYQKHRFEFTQQLVQKHMALKRHPAETTSSSSPSSSSPEITSLKMRVKTWHEQNA